MLVAHLCPAGGIFIVSEYLTAPLFAVIIGISMGVRLDEHRPPAGTFLLDNLQRGLVLVVLGVLLQSLYSQINVVLPYLGVLVIVLAPLALLLHRVPVLTLGIAGALAVVGPLVVERAREASITVAGGMPDVLGWVATGHSYRLVSFLPMALGGLALASVLRRAARPPEGYVVAGVLFVLSVAAYGLGRGHGRRELCRRGPAATGRGRCGARAVAVDRPTRPDRLHAADPVPHRDPDRRRPAP